MPRKIRIATTSMATLEDVKPPFNLRYPTAGENLALGLSLLDAAGQQSVDLVCLPESFTTAGMPYAAETMRGMAEPITGPAFQAVAELARRYQMNVVAGLPLVRDGKIQNCAVLIDRQGELIGVYAKMHPTEGEIGCGVVPGSEPAVFQTDFGKIGLAICFDLNWADMWKQMADAGADMVCWISAYPGGFPLQSYAWMHRYRVVTAVWPYEGRVIDITGRIVAQTSRWDRLVTCDLDLDKRMFHTDDQSQHILPIQARYGRRITVETLGEEHLFTIESNDPGLSVDEIISEFGLAEYDKYIARCTEVQKENLAAASKS